MPLHTPFAASPFAPRTLRELAPRALLAALGVGLLGDFLLRTDRPGLNILVLVAALVVALLALVRRTGRALTVGAILLAALAVTFAGLMAWRDAPTLVVLDVLALLTTLCALVRALSRGEALGVRDAGPLAYVAGAVSTGARVAVGAPLLAVRAIEATPIPRTTVLATGGTLARGGLLAAPALLVFGLLLTSADPTFARLLDRTFGWSGGPLFDHLAGIGLVAWAAGGALYVALRDGRAEAPCADPLSAAALALRTHFRTHGIGVREVTVAIALVDVLFVAFGVLQARWLFGGASALQSAGLTVAEYARRGFFELAVVAALTLPLLLLAHGLVGEGTPSRDAQQERRAFRLAAGVLVTLVLALLLSAADRMRLYLDAFGLTQARFYASALMLWLGFVFAWATTTLLRGRAAQFALGAVVSGWGFVLALHVVNPDARIANTNLARAASGRALDVAYLRGLSADAMPVLARRAPAVIAMHPDRAVRCALRAVLHDAADRLATPEDWRGWAASRAQARRLLPAAAGDIPVECRQGPARQTSVRERGR